MLKADRVVCKLNKDHEFFSHLSSIVELCDEDDNGKVEAIIKNYIDTEFKIRDDASQKVIHYLERYITI